MVESTEVSGGDCTRITNVVYAQAFMFVPDLALLRTLPFSVTIAWLTLAVRMYSSLRFQI